MLTECFIRNPGTLRGWIGLAVSYTNEGAYREAYRALASWLKNNPLYRHLWTNYMQEPTHELLVDRFVAAARLKTGSNLDPDVQLALGVLFNINSEYDKAIDCFEASVSSTPDVTI